MGFGLILFLLGGCFSLTESESESETCGHIRDFVSSIGVHLGPEVEGGRGSVLGALSKGTVEALAGLFAVVSDVRGRSRAGGAKSEVMSCSITEVELSWGVVGSGRGGKVRRDGQS